MNNQSTIQYHETKATERFLKKEKILILVLVCTRDVCARHINLFPLVLLLR